MSARESLSKLLFWHNLARIIFASEMFEVGLLVLVLGSGSARLLGRSNGAPYLSLLFRGKGS